MRLLNDLVVEAGDYYVCGEVSNQYLYIYKMTNSYYVEVGDVFLDGSEGCWLFCQSDGRYSGFDDLLFITNLIGLLNGLD